jgi:hypothetical protein
MTAAESELGTAEARQSRDKTETREQRGGEETSQLDLESVVSCGES